MKTVAKFGAEYFVDDYTFKMGIDLRFSQHLAQRFKDLIVLETCAGAGFSTISLARYARHVYSVEIDSARVEMARKNAEIAGVVKTITFLHGDIMTKKILDSIPHINGAFLHPDWADSGEHPIYRFINSTTRPPSDKLLQLILAITPNITLIQPPYINPAEFKDHPPHECESFIMNGKHELYALHFGRLAGRSKNSAFRV
jgi:16S rRNA G966 N2-methylase RsmD